MTRRVLATAESLGTDQAGLALLEEALALAMAPRRDRIADDHDPRFLHPGRCAVILMDDLAVTDVELVAAATLVDSRDRDLSVGLDLIGAALGGRVRDLVDAVPMSGDADLAERLVTADPEVRTLALVERLDQLRHAHLWADPEERRLAHAEALAVYAPVAERTHPRLARRYRWWCGMFERRHLSPPGGG